MTVESLQGHTPDHINCPACEASRRRILVPADFGNLCFAEAATVWLGEHSLDISPRSRHHYTGYLRTLNKFFEKLPLRQIHVGHIEQYQKWRQEPHTVNGRVFRAGPSAINHEVNTLAQVLDRAGLWTDIKKFYRPLRQPRSRAGKALTPDKERKLFDLAPRNPYWKLAYWGLLLMVNTAAGENEILHLRLCDVDQTDRSIRIFEGIKNEYRERILPLNDSAWWAMKRILKRATKCGCAKPEHYLFPHRARQRGAGWDPTRPQGSWKHAWQSLRAAAGLQDVRMYDLRHHALTKIYEEADVSESTAEEIAGHNSAKMKKTYSHIRLEMKRKALKAIEVVPGAPQLDLDFGGVTRVLEFAPSVTKKVQ